MGTFAILRKPDETPYQISECHINLWALRGLFNRRIFYWDIGLAIEVPESEKEVKEIHLTLPFKTNGTKNEWKDLSSIIKSDKNIAQLLFGRSISVNKDLIKFDSPNLQTIVSPENTGVIEMESRLSLDVIQIINSELEKAGNQPEIWTLKLVKPITKVNTCDRKVRAYIRVRFTTRNPERLWSWMNSQTVALADIRIGDTRETLLGKDLESQNIIEEWFVPIKKIRIFLIVPSNLIFRASSPETYYMRLFEGKIWEKYLDRSVALLKSEKLMIYQWRNEHPKEFGDINIKDNQTEAFRTFLVLSKQTGRFSWWNILLSSLIIYFIIYPAHILILLNLINTSTVYRFILESIIGFFVEKIGNFGIVIGLIIALIVTVGIVIKFFSTIKELFKSAKALFYKCEDKVFNLRSKF